MASPNLLPLPAYGYAGLPKGAQDALNSMMDNVIDAAQRALLSVKTRVAVVGGIALDAAIGTGISQLNGPDRGAVLAGTMTGTDWVNKAGAVLAPLLAAAQGVSDVDAANLISRELDSAGRSAVDIAAGNYGMPWWVWAGGAAVGAFVLWKMFGEKKGRLADVEPEDALDDYYDFAEED